MEQDQNCKFVDCHVCLHDEYQHEWNKRPIEDALAAELEQVKNQLARVTPKAQRVVVLSFFFSVFHNPLFSEFPGREESLFVDKPFIVHVPEDVYQKDTHKAERNETYNWWTEALGRAEEAAAARDRLHAEVESLQRQLDGEEDDGPPLTPEEIAELKAADERYLASLTPEAREAVLAIRAQFARSVLLGTGECSEPRGLFVR